MFPTMNPISDFFNGLWPTVFSAIIIVIGYFCQWKSIKKQLDAQKAIAADALDQQKEANKNELHLSVLQALFTIAQEKSKDCNEIWQNIVVEFKKTHGTSWADHLREKLNEEIINELVISKELIQKAFQMYIRAKSLLSIDEKLDVSYVFWKQLNPYLRDFFVTKSISHAIREGEIARNKEVQPTYGILVIDVYHFVKDAMEKPADPNQVRALQEITDWWRAR